MKTADITNFVAWLDSRRKFAKIMMELAIQDKNKKNEQYYLGRMNEAKLIRQHLTKKKNITSTDFSNRVKKGWKTRRLNKQNASTAESSDEFAAPITPPPWEPKETTHL